ncbi:GAF domain-containing protein [Actinopolymorpha sp. B11F2]|uniref:GAF domain-containing protein n=1 Tax=Actinopolymorpha sp. B11F2 TaxID=3160862 RepID=UPI0032E3AFC8
MAAAGKADRPRVGRALTRVQLDVVGEQRTVRALQKILSLAGRLVCAEFGVLVLADPDRNASVVITEGLADDETVGIKDSAWLATLLSRFSDAPLPVRSNDIGTDPAAFGLRRHLVVTGLVCAPIVLDNEPRGFLYVGNKAGGDRFTKTDERVILALAGAAEITVANAQLEDSQRQQRWLEALSNVFQPLVGGADEDEAPRKLIRLLRVVTGADASLIVLVDPADPQRNLVVEAADGLCAELSGLRARRVGVVSHVLDAVRPILHENVGNEASSVLPAEWVHSFSVLGQAIFAPLAYSGEVLGVLVVGWRQGSREDGFAPDEADLVGSFADAVTLAVLKERVRAERIRRQRWLTACAELVDLFSSDVDRDEALRLVIRKLREVSNADYAGIVLDPPGAGDTSVMVIEGFAPGDEVSDVPIARQGLVASVIESGRAIVSDDLPSEEGFRPPEERVAAAFSRIGLGMLVPIGHTGGVMGVLFAGWGRDSRYVAAARGEVQLVQTFADKAALVLLRGHAHQDRERRQRWLEASYELTRLHLRHRQRDEVLRIILRRLRQVSGADFAAITLQDPAGQENTVVQMFEGFGSTIDDLASVPVRVPRDGPTASVLASGQKVVSEEPTQLSGYDPRPEVTEALSVVGLGILMPLIADDENMGVLMAAWRKGSSDERAAKGEIPLVETFADQAALALLRARAEEERFRRERWLEATADMSRLLIGEVDRDEAMSLVIGRLRKIFGADFGGVMILDPADATSLSVVTMQGPGLPGISPDAQIPRGGLVARVIESGERIVSNDYPRQSGHDPPTEWKAALSVIGLGMVMPLIASGEVLGVLFAGWRRGSPHERAAMGEVQQIQTFADLAAVALQRVRAQSDRDHLLLLQDRVQIARDLHDVVLQRLFAVGLGLQNASARTGAEDFRQRLDQAIADLDQTCDNVRSTIFSLASEEMNEPPGTDKPT